ncbi:class I glutamine amidotransferase-like protein [Trichoderma citrinoviride]|uniref:D-lactate dehydratase n=1 Tax=Trichoderma citrinoviride TaxID=58853 RepID=A0A2T4BJE0_9HYPO|nr:class I glutamine amidotransferase-like protein [Trichoderma citrinoviride]PTB69420.1 class I glutamine amidotransferase-like protein [Trichoderma citrinoviride]
MAPKKVLVVLTSHDKIDAINKPTGWYLPEFAHPWKVLSDKNVEFTVVSPKGGAAPLDPGSVEMFKQDPVAASFLENQKPLWEQTQPLKQFVGRAASEFDAIFYPGGHGPMYDLVDDADSVKLIEEFAAAGKVVAAVCHGTIALVNAKQANGEPLLKGKEVTGFTNAEEEAVKLTSAMPFLVEDRVKAVGGNFVQTDAFGNKVVVDGKLITGQNPASATQLGEEIAKAIGA